jgi:hypothetical protein
MIDQDLAIRAALMQTTGTLGWQYVKDVAQGILTSATQAALDEDNPTLGESKRVKAKALQSGFSELFRVIENKKNAIADEQDDFGQLNEYEEMAHGGTDRTQS